MDDRTAAPMIEYGVTPNSLGMIGLDNSNLTIDHTMLEHAEQRRIRSEYSSLTVRNSVFTDVFPNASDVPSIDNMHEHISGRFIPDGGHFLIGIGRDDPLVGETCGAVFRNNGSPARLELLP